MKKSISSILAVCILLSGRLSSYGQSGQGLVHGMVTDSLSHAVLEEATVSLVRLPDGRLAGRRTSGRAGFRFRGLVPGNYRLITTYAGYVPDTLSLTVAPVVGNREDTLAGVWVRIRLQHVSQSLEEVVVKAAIAPATVHGDTILFNAGAFATRPYATVEDLLRKLPGVVVDHDGNVTMQGKKIDKVLIDGKEFFLGDLKVATRNLPAEIVSGIETFDTQSDQSRLMGIKDVATTRTMNIKVRADRKTGYFGKAYAGAGNDDGYSAGGTLTLMSPKGMAMGVFNSNNINNQFSGGETGPVQPGTGRQRFTSGNLLFQGQISKKLMTTFNGTQGGQDMKMTQTSHRQTFFPDSSLVEDRQSRSSSLSSNRDLSAEVKYQVDSSTILICRSGWRADNQSSGNFDTVATRTVRGHSPVGAGYLSNSGITSNSSDGSGYSFNNILEFNHHFHKKGRDLSISLMQSTQSRQLGSGLYSRIGAFDSAGNAGPPTWVHQRSLQQNGAGNYSASLSFSEPLGRHGVFSIGYSANVNSSRSDRQSFDYDSVTGRYDRPDTLTTNRFSSRLVTHRVSAGYNFTAGKFNYVLGTDAEPADMLNSNFTRDSRIHQRYVNWYPRANLSCNLATGKTLILYYAGAAMQPTIDQLQPVPDISNPLFVRIGNPDLHPQFNHNVNAIFNSFNTRTFRNIQAMLSGNFTQEKITGAIHLLPGGVQQQQFVNVNGAYNLLLSLTYGFALPGKSHPGNGSLDLHGQYMHDIGFAGQQQTATNSGGLGGLLKLNYHPTPKCYAEGSADLDYSGAGYNTAGGSSATRIWQQSYNLSLSYELPLNLSLSSSCNLRATAARGTAPSPTVLYWNAAVARKLFHNQAGEVRFSVFDLLNSNSSYAQFTTTYSVETRQANVPGRQLLLSMTYNIQRFASAHGPSSHGPSLFEK
ncbi:MAG TPA: TonB-dependent receptor [Puia sp.]|uniref:TonB-dependent receptor n=1 Tax=Puia sp. TaxID=2045100 RepID=UPI002CDD3C68|nr:TonB-dependent receptor [Puia sp.]HVU94342.1 TonB-dependent receptor [Puia sp.]